MCYVYAPHSCLSVPPHVKAPHPTNAFPPDFNALTGIASTFSPWRVQAPPAAAPPAEAPHLREHLIDGRIGSNASDMTPSSISLPR